MMRVFEFSRKRLLNIKRLLIVGDLHGDYSALKDIIYFFDPAEDGMIFLGDYADRGEFGIEVIETVRSLLMNYPNKVVALKGNHEDYTSQGRPTFFPCNLIEEVRIKRGSWQKYFVNSLKPFFKKLYLSAILPGEILFVHGGISSKIEDYNDLKNPSRDIEKDILWSDPFEGCGEYPNRRGIGIEF
jgi:serine/threonine-protein phosphatase 2B catalytic subunit